MQHVHIWRFPRMGYSEFTHLNMIFPYKPSTLGYTSMYGNHHITIYIHITFMVKPKFVKSIGVQSFIRKQIPWIPAPFDPSLLFTLLLAIVMECYGNQGPSTSMFSPLEMGIFHLAKGQTTRGKSQTPQNHHFDHFLIFNHSIFP